jgi:autotransporter translocation and assembly factor TamB
MIRAIIKWSLFLLGLAAFLGLLLVFMLSLPPGERYLQGIIQTRVQQFLGQQVRIGKFETDILSRVHMRDVRIYQETAGKTIQFLDFGQATIEYNIFELLRGKIAFRSISIRDLAINVETDSAGNTNIPLTGKKETGNRKPSKGMIAFDIQKISVSNAALRFQNRSIPLDSELMGASGELSGLGSPAWTARVSADSARFTYKTGKLTADRITMNGKWSGNRLQIDRAAANFPGMTLSCSGMEYRAGSDSLLAGQIILTGEAGTVIDFVRNAMAPGLPPMHGRVVLHAELGGSPGSPRVSTILSAPVFRVGDIQLENTLVRGSWANAVATVDSFSADAFGGNVHGHGKLDTHTLISENVSVSIRKLDVRRLGRLAGITWYGGTIDGKIEGGGYINDPGRFHAALQLAVRGPEYRSRRIPDITGTGTISDGAAVAAVAGGESKITASARIDGSRLNGEFSVDIRRLSDFAALAGLSDITGEIAARGTMGGTLSSPVVQASLVGNSISYGNFPVDSLSGGIVWRNKSVFFSDIRVTGNLASFENLRSPLRVDSLSGGMRYTGLINGSPDAPRADLTVQLEKPSYRGIRFETGSIRATVHGDTVYVEQASLERDSLQVSASGLFDYRRMAGAADIDLRAKTGGNGFLTGGSVSTQFEMKDMNAVAARVRGMGVSLPLIRQFFPALPEAGGTMSFSGTIGGGMKNPEAGLVFQILKPGFRTAGLDSLRGEVSLYEGLVLIKPLELFREDFHSIFEGSLALEKTETFFRISPNSAIQGTLKGEKLLLKYIEGLVPGIGHLSGTASYDISFGGALSNPHPEGSVTVSGFSMSAKGDTPTIQGVDLLAALHDDVITLKAGNGMILKQPYSLEARLKYTPPVFDGNIDFFLSGEKALNVSGTVTEDRLQVAAHVENFNLSLLSELFPIEGKVSGIVNSDFVVTGTLKNPHPEGTLKISNLSLNVPGVDMPLKNGIVSLNISPDRIAVDTLFVQSRKGSIRVSGTIDNILSGSADGKLRAAINNLQVRKKDIFDVTVSSAEFDLSKTGNVYSMDGKAKLGESLILYDFTVPSLLKKLTAPGGPLKASPEFMKQVRMDIFIDGGKKLSIRNSLVKIPVRADLELIGTLAAPNMIGEVTATEGEVHYLDRTFKITDGTIEFTNRTKMNPVLNVQAETTVTGSQSFGNDSYRVTLSVTGTMEKPGFKLTSDPYLDTPNIISLLTLGVTRQQVGIGAAASDTTSSLQDVLKQRAELLTSQRIGGYIGRRIGNVLGLEEVTVEGNLFNLNGETGGPRIIASKQFSDKIEVTSITTLGLLSNQGIRVNYAVTDKIALQGETDTQGRSGFDVLYRLRFK